jgi:hypothetical protein
VEVVEVVDYWDRDPRTVREWIGALPLPRGRAVVALAVVAAVLATGAGAIIGPRNGQRQRVSGVAREPGAAGVAAAYGYPLRCLSVTFLVPDRDYARADFNHSYCGRYTWDPTAIFHRTAGAWRPMLNAVQYHCPVGSLPAAVQTQLGVCP